MKFSTNKAKATVVIFVLVLTFSALLAAFPTVGAHDPPWTVPTWAFISASNNPIGVNQQTVIVFWPNEIPPTSQGAYGDRWTWNIEVTKPDGTKETLGPFTSDPVGGGWTTYTPDQVGTYTFVAIMDDHVMTGEPFPPSGDAWGTATIGDTYLGDTSDPYELTVQEDPIEAWSETPLPTEYWTRPINDMNREWYVLAGNWLAGAAQNVGPTTNFNYGTGPESAHIMWATPMWAGGIMDARFGDIGYQTAHYEGLEFTPPIILNGKLYYNVASLPKYGWYCLDLYTGEVDYFHNTTGPVTGVGNMLIPGFGWVGFDSSGEIAGEKLSWGQIYNYESPNQHGGMPYLWSTGSAGGFMAATGTTWMMFDAYTGNYICSIANASDAGTAVYGKEGSILRYNIVGSPNPAGAFFPDVAPFYLQVWNTSRAIWYEEEWQINEYWMWRPVLNKTFDGNNGFSLNVSIPAVQGDILAVREGEFIIGGTAGANDVDAPLVMGNLWCLSLEPGQEGTLLWNKTFTPPYDVVPSTVTGAGGLFAAGIEGPTVDPEDGVFLFNSPITREWWGYSLDTMEPLWGPTEPEHSMNYYGMYSNIYDGKLYSFGYGGEIVAYDITTGKVLWTYTATNVGYESPYGNYPIYVTAIADGKLYTTSGEHSITQPMWRGPNLRCLDANTGNELWKISFFGADGGAHLTGTNIVMADGYVVGLNYYDNQIYCLGKGPSSTTVTASPKIIAKGNSVMIEGTVTDQSPGTKTTEIMAKSPNAEGVPAIADEYQEDWMEYLYMQQAIPAYFEGVEVSLDAVDPNGNFIHIDTVRSDMSGMFKKMWTPDTEGEYTIMATFGGSKAYYSSYAETAIGVGPAPAPVQPIEPEEPTAEAPLITTEIAIIIAVVIVAIIGIVAYWALRKRE
jgi:outer membrane protein assembly factor BamB